MFYLYMQRKHNKVWGRVLCDHPVLGNLENLTLTGYTESKKNKGRHWVTNLISLYDWMVEQRQREMAVSKVPYGNKRPENVESYDYHNT